jgi:hypothetical protein
MRDGVHELIQAVSHGDRGVIEKADALIHGLDDLLREERWDSTSLEIGPIKRRATP